MDGNVNSSAGSRFDNTRNTAVGNPTGNYPTLACLPFH
jgi:hypothetical protein